MKKMKLDIQRFNSTNKTTHYELSQYVANDKPTYLVDYNDDMVAIDTAIYEAKTQADLGVNDASVAQTTAENAQTTANTAVTNAGVAQTTADDNTTKIGDLANLTTANKANLVSAISEVNDKTPQLLNSYTSSTTDGYCANYVNNLNSYSSDEVQCGTWFGKKKYRKSYHISALANTGSTYTPLDITNLKEVISISGLASDGETFFPLPDYRGAQDALGIQLYADIVNGIIITTGNDRTSYHANITIEYTKTTD